MTEEQKEFPSWMRGVLLIAGVYNLIWGLFIYNFQDSFFSWLMESNRKASAIIQYQGLGVIIFGFFYLTTALFPLRFWYLALLGVLSKSLGALAVYFFVIEQQVTQKFIFHLLVNDLIWVLPLSIITLKAYRLQKS